MKKVKILRDKPDPATIHLGQFGEIFYGMNSCYTAEPSKPIPDGVYKCTPYESPRLKYRLYLLAGVEGHDGVEIHKGNFAGDAPLKCDTSLCILLGNAIGEIAGQKALLRSKDAFDRFMLEMENEPFELTIETKA